VRNGGSFPSLRSCWRGVVQPLLPTLRSLRERLARVYNHTRDLLVLPSLMESSPTFLKWRAAAFGCISFVSLLWIILLCIIVFERWDLLDRPEKSFLSVLLIANTINLLMLPILILCEFRPWLDAARLLYLLLANIGISAFFTYWNPKFRCPEQNADSGGVCKLINMYILLANWVNPGLLIAYSNCLAFLVWWRSRQPPSIATEVGFGDEEATTGVGHSSMIPTTKILEIASRRPSTLTLTAPAISDVTLPKTPSRDLHSWERDIYINDNGDHNCNESSVGGSTFISTSSASRLSKQRLRPSMFY